VRALPLDAADKARVAGGNALAFYRLGQGGQPDGLNQ
jgi:hypothetical protein